MTVRVAHLKVSTIPDSDDTSLVRPSDWNEDHVVEGLGTAAEANSSDLLSRANHTGTQLAATISDFSTAADARVSAAIGVTAQAYSANLASWAGVTRASGFDTFAATPSSANLRSLMTDETGTGALLFAGGNYGTPSALVLTNATGLPNASVIGLGTAALQNTGTSGANLPFLNGTNTWANAQTFSANPLVNGGGVQFPATQVASADANCLDDYEEGSFTPALSATGSTFSYSAQTGRYIKLGRLVYVAIAVSLNTSGNTLTANTLSITGLPFTTSSAAGQRIIGSWQNSTTSYTTVLGFINTSATTINMSALGAAATSYPGSVNADALCHATNGTQLRLTGAYEAA